METVCTARGKCIPVFRFVVVVAVGTAVIK